MRKQYIPPKIVPNLKTSNLGKIVVNQGSGNVKIKNIIRYLKMNSPDITITRQVNKRNYNPINNLTKLMETHQQAMLRWNV